VEEQPLNLRRGLEALRRRWHVVAGAGAIGMVVGIAYGLVAPATVTSNALVLLSPSPATPTGEPSVDIGTEVEIAMSAGIMGPVGAAQHPVLSFAQMQQHVHASALTSNLLQITGKSSSPAGAKALANGVAAAFVRGTTGSLAAVADALVRERAQVQNQLSDLNREITQASTQSAPDVASLVTSLQSEQQLAQLQLDSVESQLAQVNLSESTRAAGALVLQDAETAVSPSAWRVPAFVLLGIFLGLVIGVATVLVLAARDHRLRRRADVAHAIGAPVLISASSRAARSQAEWIDLLERWEPSISDSWTIRSLLHQLGAGREATDVQVVVFDRDARAMSFAPQLAAVCAANGVPTTITMTANSESGAMLASACESLGGRRLRTKLSSALFLEADNVHLDKFRISVVVVDPDEPTWPAVGKTAKTVVAVSAGFATAEQLGGFAIYALQSGQVIDGVVLVDPDPFDRTAGRVVSHESDQGAVTERPFVVKDVR